MCMDDVINVGTRIIISAVGGITLDLTHIQGSYVNRNRLAVWRVRKP